MGRSAYLLAVLAVPIGLCVSPAFASRTDMAQRSSEDCSEREAQKVSAKALKPVIVAKPPKKRRYILM